MRVQKSQDYGDTLGRFLKVAQESERKIRVMAFQGSARNKENCPDQWGKTRRAIDHAVGGLPDDVEVDYCDLSVKADGNIVQPCKACVSTSGGFHCHWPCTCYSKGDEGLPDFMYNEDVYARLERADAFIVYTPINWYAPSSVVKSLFDRLVCANLTLTKAQAEELYGEGDIKSAEKTRMAEKSGKYHGLLRNHLEGKVAAFFAHGDNGAADYKELANDPEDGYPELPSEYRRHLKHDDGHLDEGNVNDPKRAVAPLVWQCRYSAIDVPDDLVVGFHVNKGVGYAEGNDAARRDEKFLEAGRDLLLRLVAHVREKKGGGDVRPGRAT